MTGTRVKYQTRGIKLLTCILNNLGVEKTIKILEEFETLKENGIQL